MKSSKTIAANFCLAEFLFYFTLFHIFALHSTHSIYPKKKTESQQKLNFSIWFSFWQFHLSERVGRERWMSELFAHISEGGSDGWSECVDHGCWSTLKENKATRAPTRIHRWMMLFCVHIINSGSIMNVNYFRVIGREGCWSVVYF